MKNAARILTVRRVHLADKAALVLSSARSNEGGVKANAGFHLHQNSSVDGFIFITLHCHLATRYAVDALKRDAGSILARHMTGKSTMTSISTHGPHDAASATIYQFPIGGRAGLNASRDDLRLDHIQSVKSNEYALTDAWYHQEAIRDAQATKQ